MVKRQMTMEEVLGGSPKKDDQSPKSTGGTPRNKRKTQETYQESILPYVKILSKSADGTPVNRGDVENKPEESLVAPVNSTPSPKSGGVTPGNDHPDRPEVPKQQANDSENVAPKSTSAAVTRRRGRARKNEQQDKEVQDMQQQMDVEQPPEVQNPNVEQQKDIQEENIDGGTLYKKVGGKPLGVQIMLNDDIERVNLDFQKLDAKSVSLEFDSAHKTKVESAKVEIISQQQPFDLNQNLVSSTQHSGDDSQLGGRGKRGMARQSNSPPQAKNAPTRKGRSKKQNPDPQPSVEVTEQHNIQPVAEDVQQDIAGMQHENVQQDEGRQQHEDNNDGQRGRKGGFDRPADPEEHEKIVKSLLEVIVSESGNQESTRHEGRQGDLTQESPIDTQNQSTRELPMLPMQQQSTRELPMMPAQVPVVVRRMPQNLSARRSLPLPEIREGIENNPHAMTPVPVRRSSLPPPRLHEVGSVPLMPTPALFPPAPGTRIETQQDSPRLRQYVRENRADLPRNWRCETVFIRQEPLREEGPEFGTDVDVDVSIVYPRGASADSRSSNVLRRQLVSQLRRRSTEEGERPAEEMRSRTVSFDPVATVYMVPYDSPTRNFRELQRGSEGRRPSDPEVQSRQNRLAVRRLNRMIERLERQGLYQRDENRLTARRGILRDAIELNERRINEERRRRRSAVVWHYAEPEVSRQDDNPLPDPAINSDEEIMFFDESELDMGPLQLPPAAQVDEPTDESEPVEGNDEGQHSEGGQQAANGRLTEYSDQYEQAGYSDSLQEEGYEVELYYDQRFEPLCDCDMNYPCCDECEAEFHDDYGTESDLYESSDREDETETESEYEESTDIDGAETDTGGEGDSDNAQDDDDFYDEPQNANNNE
ncbi:pp1a, putative [Babesia ovata]|uniref:Pp1a, putative n=2 Tax=Babesia ovata TaxID=189622 RepID=A0A2H6KK06_9APIC|nr:pp1a, putative [Babesia ovata]GBE63335.1 pp1a, putative [Babesia ovata]